MPLAGCRNCSVRAMLTNALYAKAASVCANVQQTLAPMVEHRPLATTEHQHRYLHALMPCLSCSTSLGWIDKVQLSLAPPLQIPLTMHITICLSSTPDMYLQARQRAHHRALHGALATHLNSEPICCHHLRPLLQFMTNHACSSREQAQPRRGQEMPPRRGLDFSHVVHHTGLTRADGSRLCHAR